MAELTPVDPADVHAVVVGLESYPAAPGVEPLPGAADDALRFARWLRAGDVPRENIALFLSVPDERKDATQTAAHAVGAPRSACTVEAVRRAFVQELSAAGGRLLYVYWGGHGLVSDGERLLLTPDSTDTDLRCISVEDLLAYLSRADRTGFDEQVLLFDACATFVENYQLGHTPKPVHFPGCTPDTARQFVLSAAREGQVAEQDSAAGTGVFSRTVLEWLESHASDVFPGLSTLEEAVRSTFAGRSAAGGPPQTPTAYRYQSLDGTEKFAARYAVWVDPGARLELAGTLHRVLGGDDVECRIHAGRVAQVCSVAQLAARYSVERFAEVLLNTPRAMASFVEALSREEEPRPTYPFLALALRHQAPGLLSVREHGELRELLARWPVLSAATVNAVTQAAVPGIPVHVEAVEPLTTAQVMAHVTRLEEHPGGGSRTNPRTFTVPVAVAFVRYLAALPDRGDPEQALREQLDDWSDRVCRRLCVDPSDHRRVSEEAAAWGRTMGRSRTASRVVVQVYPQDKPETYICVVWTDPGTGELSQYPRPENGTELSSAEAVRLIGRAVRSLSDDTTALVVEVVLQPDDLLDVPVHTWDGAHDSDWVPLQFGVEQRISLRCAPLASRDREEHRQTALKRRWAGRAAGHVVYLDEWHAESPRHRAYGTLAADLDAARVAVRSGRTTGAGLVRAALALGYPVVLWESGTPASLTETHFAPLEPDGELHGLPERVRAYWAKVCEDPARHPVRPALLFEDHERELPDPRSMTRPSFPEETS